MMLPSIRLQINNTHYSFPKDLAQSRAVMGQNVQQGSDFPLHYNEIGELV